MTSRHPSDENLALLAGGDCGALTGISLRWHLRRCAECEEKLVEFQDLRAGVSAAPLPELDWDRIGMEMRANIHLGIEAGECVRAEIIAPVRGNRQLIFACAGVAMAMCLSVFVSMRVRTPVAPIAVSHETVLQATSAGLQVRTGSGSLTLLSGHGQAPDRTAVAQGTIRASYIDGETGKVTVTSVYQE